jgi:hypothetical protein
MFMDWMRNFKLVVRDTYGTNEVPFRTPTNDELRQRYEAGLDPEDALWDIAGEIIPGELLEITE